MTTRKTKKILISPLDWGLGHTTRCIPIIRHIRSRGHEVFVAGNDSQLTFLKDTFDDVSFLPLEGYNIRYSKWNKWGQAGLLSQLPQIMRAISTEHKWLQQQADEHKFDGIISDNRYGLFHKHIPSVILTHQLQVLTGVNKATDNIVRRLHYKYLNRFGETWVADTEQNNGLAGKLSHPQVLPHNTKYIGLLSRFSEGVIKSSENITNILVLLSGPEPQRTAFAQLLWQQVLHLDRNVIFVAGSDAAKAPAVVPPHITYHKRLSGDVLSRLLKECDIVICRSGYSTLMDLAALHKQAIIIPTPGQTEQKYLGSYLHNKGAYYCAQQKTLDLQQALHNAAHFPFHSAVTGSAYSEHQTVIDGWLSTLH